MSLFQKIIQTDNSKTTILIRLMVGAIFLSEGIQKFLFPEIVGTGRFEKIKELNYGLFENSMVLDL